MFDNNTYNLLEQLATEHKSLWRIKNSYQGDSGDDAETKAFWKKMEKDKEEHITEMSAMLVARLQN